MYHLGKVLRVFSTDSKDILGADNTVQAMVEMWDENTFIFMVHPMLNPKLKANDIVLVEYDFMGGNRQPRQTVVKILRGRTAEDCWKKMTHYFAEIKRKQSPAQVPQLPFDIGMSPENMVR